MASQKAPSHLGGGRLAEIIKGDRAQACIPPLLTLFQTEQPRPPQPSQEFEDDVNDDIGSSNLDYDIESQWSGGTTRSEDVTDMDIEAPSGRHPLPAVEGDAANLGDPFPQFPQRHPQFDDSYSPTPEGDASPEPNADEDPASSPLGPITPFGVFVDRAVAAAQFSNGPEVLLPTLPPGPHSPYGIRYGAQLHASIPQYEAASQRPETVMPPVQDVIPMPSATHSYKKVADPLAEWVATYIWKVCTTGMSLHTQYTGGSFHQYPPLPPAYLANSIHSLLLSTLLQPSAVLLAVWYIVRLPVRFGRVSLRPDAMKEVRFRLELLDLGEWQDSGCAQAAEAHAPFRLVLLGCMLANKWLDDHTFSNKTWHTISGVPIQSLNRLESLALDIFSYDLSIAPQEWNKWLDHVLTYHKSLASVPNPQLISRPSSNPHFVVRKTLEDLVETAIASTASRPCGDPSCPKSHPQPVFLGLEERRRARLDPTSVETRPEALEIDLDEDGPFRLVNGIEWERAPQMQKGLPPPAKWSPAADEPLRRDGIREPTHYMAVQPPPIPPLLVMPLYPSNGHSMAYAHGWGPGAPAFLLPPPPVFGQPFDYNHVRSIPVIDGRHHLLQDGGHCWPQSTRVEYPCSSSAAKLPYQIPELCWTGAEQYDYDVAYGQGSGHKPIFPQYGPHWVGH